MSKKISWSVGVIAAVVLLFGFSTAQAVTATATLSGVSGTSTTAGATGVTYTATMVVNSTMPADSDLLFNFQGNVPHEAGFDFSSAAISITGATGNLGDNNTDHLNYRLSTSLSAGTKTVTITGVKNATQAGLFTFKLQYGVPGMPPGSAHEEITASAPTAVGNIAIMGKVKMPDGSLVSNEYGIGVNVRTDDFSQNFGTGVSDGWYAFGVQGDQGTFQAGTAYFLETWPGSAPNAVSPDPVPFTYNGSTITKHLTFVTASKTLKVLVKYPDGSAVTTADAWANKTGGGSHVNGTVNSSGLAEFGVTGGSWEVGVNCGWNHEANTQNICDWTYNQPPSQVTFADNSSSETKTLTITVVKTDAIIKGTVYYYDDNGVKQLLPGGHVDIRAGERGGSGTHIDNQGDSKGKFTANVKAGKYILMVNPDTWNDPSMGKYYSEEILVDIVKDQTMNLTIIMNKYTAQIEVTVKDTDGNLVPNIWINAWKQQGMGWGNGKTNANGVAVIYASEGQWGVDIDTHRPPEPGQESSANYISVNTGPNDITVPTTGTKATTLLVDIADASITLSVVDQSGSAITNFFGGAHCEIKGMFGPGQHYHTGLDQGTGTIWLKGDATKEYSCGLWVPPDMDFSLEEEVKVTVGVDENKSIKLVLKANDAAIIGWLKDQNGKVITSSGDEGGMKGPGSGGIGEVFAITVGDWQWKPGVLNADGSFRISVVGDPDKQYMIGFHPWDRENSEYLESHPEPESAFTVAANTEKTKVITVFRATTSISGTVYLPDGTPAGHVWVGADNHMAHEGKLMGDFEGGQIMHVGTDSDENGRFNLNLIDDTWNLHAGFPPHLSGDYMSPQEISVTVTSDSPATGKDLYFREADAFVNVTATFEDGTSPEFGWCWAWSENGGHNGRELMGGSSRIPVTSGGSSVTYNVGCDTFNPSDNGFFRAVEKQVTVSKGDEKSLNLTLVEEMFQIPESFTQTFDATQQNSFVMPDGTSVEAPPNSFGSNSDSTYTFFAEPKTELYHSKDAKHVMYAWDFSVQETDSSGNTSLVETFQSNVSITITIPADVVAGYGLMAADVLPRYYNSISGSWETISNATTYMNTDGSITGVVQVDHFTEFSMTTTSTALGITGSTGPQYVVATPISAGGPQVTVWDGDGGIKLNFFAYSSTLRMGIQALTGDVDGDGTDEIIVAAGAGGGPQIRIFNLSGQVIGQFMAFPTHIRTGMNLAIADVDGDGVDEIIATTMAGAGPQVRVFNGSGEVENQFFAYAETFRGGVALSTGDVDGDGVAEIITIPDSNSAPQVRVFDNDGSVVSQFFAYAETVRGTYHLTTGDVNGDGTADIVVTPGPGLGPQVAMFTGNGDLIGRFFAYATTFRGGLHASVGDVSGNGINEIVCSPESGAGPHMRVFNSAGEVVSQFWAYAETLRGSFTSFVADVTQDGTADIVTAPGAGMGPQVRIFGYDGSAVSQYFTHHTGFRGGINITSMPTF